MGAGEGAKGYTPPAWSLGPGRGSFCPQAPATSLSRAESCLLVWGRSSGGGGPMTGPQIPNWASEHAPEVAWPGDPSLDRWPEPPQPWGGWWQAQGLSSGAGSLAAGPHLVPVEARRVLPTAALSLTHAHGLTLTRGNNHAVWAEPAGREGNPSGGRGAQAGERVCPQGGWDSTSLGWQVPLWSEASPGQGAEPCPLLSCSVPRLCPLTRALGCPGELWPRSPGATRKEGEVGKRGPCCEQG